MTQSYGGTGRGQAQLPAQLEELGTPGLAPGLWSSSRVSPSPSLVLRGYGWLGEARAELWGPPGNTVCTYGFVSGREREVLRVWGDARAQH